MLTTFERGTRARIRALALLVALLPAACDSAPEGSVAAGGDMAPAGPSCDADNGGISLPDGFCATVFADLGSARHLVVRDNGDVFVTQRNASPSLMALRDSDGDGRADVSRRFVGGGGTGIGIDGGYLYFAPTGEIRRYRLRPGELLPDRQAEVVATLPAQQSHSARALAFDGAGSVYVNIGAPSNACQTEARTPGSPGLDPCPQLEQHGGVWRFDTGRTGQAFADGERYATGIRNAVAIDWNARTGRLYVVQHGRDQLDQLWPALFTTEQRVELPAEEFFAVERGDNFGWPYCYYDPGRGAKVLAPEYGGDGTRIGRCDKFKLPELGFPAHWAPNDLIFYHADAFPPAYRDGAFVAFHGSWNRAPAPQAGFRVVFVPFADGAAAGTWEDFATGFAATEPIGNPRDARYRPTGLAVGPDGALYIADSVRGRIWRVVYAP